MECPKCHAVTPIKVLKLQKTERFCSVCKYSLEHLFKKKRPRDDNNAKIPSSSTITTRTTTTGTSTMNTSSNKRRRDINYLPTKKTNLPNYDNVDRGLDPVVGLFGPGASSSSGKGESRNENFVRYNKRAPPMDLSIMRTPGAKGDRGRNIFRGAYDATQRFGTSLEVVWRKKPAIMNKTFKMVYNKYGKKQFLPTLLVWKKMHEEREGLMTNNIDDATPTCYEEIYVNNYGSYADILCQRDEYNKARPAAALKNPLRPTAEDIERERTKFFTKDKTNKNVGDPAAKTRNYDKNIFGKEGWKIAIENIHNPNPNVYKRLRIKDDREAKINLNTGAKYPNGRYDLPLRVPPHIVAPDKRVQPCPFWLQYILCKTIVREGECPYGAACCFPHNLDELNLWNNWVDNEEEERNYLQIVSAIKSRKQAPHLKSQELSDLYRKRDYCICLSLLNIGFCPKGDGCFYPHTVEEAKEWRKIAPKDNFCTTFILRGVCKDGALCTEAHSREELYEGKPSKKITKCLEFTNLNRCRRGNFCTHWHGPKEFNKLICLHMHCVAHPHENYVRFHRSRSRSPVEFETLPSTVDNTWHATFGPGAGGETYEYLMSHRPRNVGSQQSRYTAGGLRGPRGPRDMQRNPRRENPNNIPVNTQRRLQRGNPNDIPVNMEKRRNFGISAANNTSNSNNNNSSVHKNNSQSSDSYNARDIPISPVVVADNFTKRKRMNNEPAWMTAMKKK